MGLRKSVVLCLIGMGMFLSTGPASAQGSVSYTISPTAGPADTTITFAGTGCPQETDPTVTRAEVRFEVFATVGVGVSQGSYIAFGGAQSNPDGSFSGTATPISANAELGVHQTQIVCTGGRLQGATFTVTAGSTTSSSTTTTIAPTTSSSTTTSTVAPVTTVSAASDTTTSTTNVPSAVADDTNAAATADPSTATTAPAATVLAATNSTNQPFSAQSTNTTTSGSLALTGADNLDFMLAALCFIFAAATVACFLNTPWFARFEKVIRRLGEVIVDPFAPPTRQ